ncbi:MAG: Uncharacterised protein [Flavobacterium sp. SCGC AAA160-P02]|nr:MAG: Uncharacterised protein [Flavobacterium sp. SCGC AAA160-P02]
MPPNTFGCNVLTLPPKIDGYEVMSSTAVTGISNCLINFSVPPVEYRVTLFLCSASTIGFKPSLWKTDMSADLMGFLSLIFLLD